MADSLHEHKINATLELELQCEECRKEAAKHTDRLLRCFDHVTQEAEAWVTALNTSCELITVKLKLQVEKAKRETIALRVKYENREE